MVNLSVYVVGGSPEMTNGPASRLGGLPRVNVVATARDEPGAIQWLTKHHNDADLVIVDIFLKSGSGLGVLRRSRALPRRRKVVVLSNFAGGELRRTCMALGAAQVFDKTTGIDSLLAYCENLAAGLALQ